MSSEIVKNVNPDLVLERKKCTFDVEELARWWNGGEKELLKKREMEKFLSSNNDFEEEIPTSYLSHKESYEHEVQKSVKIYQKLKTFEGATNFEKSLETNTYVAYFMPNEGMPFRLHYSMFIPTLLGQATDEQKAQWLDKAWKLQILGTYAQTELGHGTFIRGLETRATYDNRTEEFVLHTPSISAYKWWPGGLGHSANYAVVVAQLYSNGKCHGIQPFMVQLRDEETWEPMAGITIGEIGPKLGMKTINNGYLGFNNVRIPRKNMLMKNNQVLADGTFIKSPASVLTYGTMVYVRVYIVKNMSFLLSKAATIATRYSAVRRQSPIKPRLPEPQVMDHVTQQNKLFPNIARAVVFKLTSDYIFNMYNEVTLELNAGNLDRLPELHALACCLKSVCTAEASTGIETLRLACGGHGYMLSSGLPSIYGMATAACTYEGENTVLLLQSARYLMKAWSKFLQGGVLGPTVSYLSKEKRAKSNEWDFSGHGLVKALQIVASNKIRLAYEHVQKHKDVEGISHENATNLSSIELVQAAEAHCRAFIVYSTFEMVKTIKQNTSTELAKVLHYLIEMYAIEAALKSIGDLIRFTGITDGDIEALQYRLENVQKRIRPNAVGIVDGFDISDLMLQSTLGAYDGNIYERIFNEAQKSTLNQDKSYKAFNSYLNQMLKSNL